MPLASGLANVDVLMVNVADLSDGCHTVHAHNTHFARGHTDLCIVALFRH